MALSTEQHPQTQVFPVGTVFAALQFDGGDVEVADPRYGQRFWIWGDEWELLTPLELAVREVLDG